MSEPITLKDVEDIADFVNSLNKSGTERDEAFEFKAHTTIPIFIDGVHVKEIENEEESEND